VHAAGVLADGVVDSLDAAAFARVLPVKAGAADHLHELTADRPLTAFVLFSSAAAVLGSAMAKTQIMAGVLASVFIFVLFLCWTMSRVVDAPFGTPPPDAFTTSLKPVTRIVS